MAVRRDLDRLERWPDRNLIQFNKRNGKIFYLGRNNAMNKCNQLKSLQERMWKSWNTLS